MWADGIHVNVRLEDDANKKQCILVLIGATPDGRKELIAILDGYRESEQSWSELLLGLKHRGLTMAPKVAVADGALGFWSAARKVFLEMREQRCWVHKTANVLNNLPPCCVVRGVFSPKPSQTSMTSGRPKLVKRPTNPGPVRIRPGTIASRHWLASCAEHVRAS